MSAHAALADPAHAMTARRHSLLGSLMVWTIRGYQKLISRYTPPSCRFTPTCSSYAVTAVRVHGPLRGTWMATWRVLRCHPFHPGGHDPVPRRREAPGESVD
ncbi:MAG: putative membrane protein insertion efficiency factor [Myxococcota bacterium]|jgi:putative membrane protein insertion efficiency factor